MISKVTRNFWALYQKLPLKTQALAVEKFRTWRRDPFHLSLHFKQLTGDLWSVRINLNYRALARRKGEMILWFWIGNHADYDRLIGH